MLAFVVEEDKRSGKLLVIGKICQDLMKSQYGESDPSSNVKICMRNQRYNIVHESIKIVFLLRDII